jgi:hypothetical protein
MVVPLAEVLRRIDLGGVLAVSPNRDKVTVVPAEMVGQLDPRQWQVAEIVDLSQIQTSDPDDYLGSLTLKVRDSHEHYWVSDNSERTNTPEEEEQMDDTTEKDEPTVNEDGWAVVQGEDPKETTRKLWMERRDDILHDFANTDVEDILDTDAFAATVVHLATRLGWRANQPDDWTELELRQRVIDAAKKVEAGDEKAEEELGKALDDMAFATVEDAFNLLAAIGARRDGTEVLNAIWAGEEENEEGEEVEETK